MAGYDVIDEHIVHAPPSDVWEALIAELSGARKWWIPHNTFAPGKAPVTQIGGESHVTVHTRGVDHRGLELRFTARTRVIDPPRRLETAYVAGVFRGKAVYTLQPYGDGSRTKLTMRFQATPHGWLKILAKVAKIDEEHSKATRAAFRKLDALVWTEPDAAPADTGDDAGEAPAREWTAA